MTRRDKLPTICSDAVGPVGGTELNLLRNPVRSEPFLEGDSAFYQKLGLQRKKEYSFIL